MYIPKNKIKTDQYTRGGEYQTALNGTPYVGSYWTMYNGKIFSGINPNDTPQEELLSLESTPSPTYPSNTLFQEYSYNWNKETVPGQYQNMNTIITYNNIKRVDMNVNKLLPQNSVPLPTKKDYKAGVFTRYFCIKINEVVIIELTKLFYEKMSEKDLNIDWVPYRLFILKWVITGDEEDVLQTNFNQVALVEKRLGRKGLGEYLMGNYIQHYARNSGEILYSNGEGGLILPDGTAYIGYYHAMLDGTLMTGKYHGRGQDIVLTEIYD
jgi:hypothetical protein|tara:strand:+ start:4108 stop:4911 length:804 start_codon:yes stop_codon:yes gene_type:complete